MTNQNRSVDRQLRRAAQRGAMRRSTMFILVLLACVGAVASQWRHAGALAAHASQNFVRWTVAQGFTIQDVRVAGRVNVPAAFVSDALDIERGLPLVAYDVSGAHDRLMANPWFKTVKVERHLPQTVFVTLTERVPAARWQMDGKLALVDADGVVLETGKLEAYKHLPVIVGQQARHKIRDLFLLMVGQPELARHVVAATWVGNRRWDLRLDSTMTVKLPADDAALALARLAELALRDNLLDRDIKIVDLRVIDRAVLTPSVRANTVIERPDFSDSAVLVNKESI
jgi:cell division protein FtsQ